MSQALADQGVPVHDLVGVGFGPSNLALAIALTESSGLAPLVETHNPRPTTAVFLERQPRFGWHRGMLIDDATMQVSFLKDLVTMRNPASEFSFLCYLHARGRLIDFVNHKNLFPLRVEFHDYLEWAAAKVDGLVRYGHEVTGIEPVLADGAVVAFDVHARSAEPARTTVCRAANLVIGTGLRPHLPAGLTPSNRIWHNSELLPRVEELDETSPARFIVVGAGQSAAEATAFLHRRFPNAEVCAVFSRYGYSPADDSPFANRIFDPAAVDDFFVAPEEIKRKLLAYHGNTNYSVVDIELIDDLYRRAYQEKVLGAQRLRFLNVSRLPEVVETANGVHAVVESLATGRHTRLEADAVVYCTGYLPADPVSLLGPLARHCRLDPAGRPRVERDYRLVTAPELRAGIYLQGGTEHTHGITSSLLSNVAVRAEEILQSIIARRPAMAPRRPELATSSATG